jgi:hypothetical protein
MSTLAQSSLVPLVPAWVVVPLAVVVLLLLGAHVHLTARICVPESRRRIRMVNGVLMMMIVPVAAYALAIVPPASQRPFVLAWMLVAGLLCIVLALAVVDALNTMRLHANATRELRTLMRQALPVAAPPPPPPPSAPQSLAPPVPPAPSPASDASAQSPTDSTTTPPPATTEASRDDR